ncbi:MAG: M24 family metallopeptidase, partial [Halobacteriota archaeon]
PGTPPPRPDPNFPGDEVRVADEEAAAGERVVAVLDELAPEAGRVLVPRHLPHDAAVYLERAGYDLASTPAVSTARAVKTDAELVAIRAVQRIATRGVKRVAEILAASTVEGDELHWEGGPLSTTRLRRQANATMALYGGCDLGNAVVTAGEASADPHGSSVEAVEPGETVVVDLSPRGPAGYYGDCGRTFVVGGDGGWERRAHVAVEAARNAALSAIEPGTVASTIYEEAAAELAAYGFEVANSERGFVRDAGHGVGLSLHERPSLSTDAILEPGMVLAISPNLFDPDRGSVRVEDLVVVTDDGCDLLVDAPRSLDPVAWV